MVSPQDIMVDMLAYFLVHRGSNQPFLKTISVRTFYQLEEQSNVVIQSLIGSKAEGVSQSSKSCSSPSRNVGYPNL